MLDSMNLRTVKFILVAVIVLFPVASLLAYFVSGMVFGGDALQGKIVGGHYYLGEKGQFTEVGRGIFLFSLWHGRVMIASFVLMAVAGITLTVWAWVVRFGRAIWRTLGKRVLR